MLLVGPASSLAEPSGAAAGLKISLQAGDSKLNLQGLIRKLESWPQRLPGLQASLRRLRRGRAPEIHGEIRNKNPDTGGLRPKPAPGPLLRSQVFRWFSARFSVFLRFSAEAGPRRFSAEAGTPEIVCPVFRRFSAEAGPRNPP